MRIHHVALTVRNLGASIAWYTDIFDARVIDTYEKHGLEIAQLKIGDAWIELFAGGESELPEYRKTLKGDISTVGTKHLALETDDLDALVKKLREKSVVFETEPDTAHFGGQYVFIKDLDGILIELYQK